MSDSYLAAIQARTADLAGTSSADAEVVYKDVLGAFVDAAITEMSDKKPDDPYRKMYEFLFQASLVDDRNPNPPPRIGWR